MHESLLWFIIKMVQFTENPDVTTIIICYMVCSHVTIKPAYFASTFKDGAVITSTVTPKRRTQSNFYIIIACMETQNGKQYINTKCNTFTPQIKGIPKDTCTMYTSTQGDIQMYAGVH